MTTRTLTGRPAPTITVGITYFNEGPMLTECLESLARQTSIPDEILVYDDASSMPPDRFLPSELPVRVIRGATNRGPSAGRNALTAACTSSHIHFHDADDSFDPEWCEQVKRKLSTSPVDVVFTECTSYRGDQVVSRSVIGLRRLLDDADLLGFAIDGVLLTPSGTYPKDLVVRCGGYNERLWQSEDFDFHLRLAALEPQFAIIDEPLVWQRLHEGSRSRDGAACSRDLVKALTLLPAALQDRYKDRICQRVAGAACSLYRFGDPGAADDALNFARTLGTPRFDDERQTFRRLAVAIGPKYVVQAANAYRRFVPATVRNWVAGQGL
jgi:glycosyltransferase involved in cell wall biosynthesis